MLNKNDHRQKRDLFRALGMALVAVGGVFALIGFGSFFAAFGGWGFPRYFWCAFIGLPMMAGGSALLKMGFMGEIARYKSDEIVPVAKDIILDVAGEAKPAVKKVVLAAREAGDEGRTVEERLRELDTLRSRSLITEPEYQEQRRRILDNI